MELLLFINFISTHEHFTFGQFGNFAIKKYCKIAVGTKLARNSHESQVFNLKTSYLQILSNVYVHFPQG